MPRVFIPVSLRSHTDGEAIVEVEGTNVRALLDALDLQYSGLRQRLCEGDRLRPGLAVAVGSRISDRGLLTPVLAEEEVHFVQAAGGG